MSPLTRRVHTKTGLPKGIRLRTPATETQGPVYQVNFTVKGKRVNGTAHSLDEAITLRDQIEATLVEKMGGIIGKGWTLKEAIERCYESVWSSAQSGDKLRDNAEAVALFLGSKILVSDITTERINSLIAHLKSVHRNSGATINRKLAALSKVLRHARRCAASSGLMTLPHLERQKESEGRIRFLTKDEETTLLGLLTSWSKLDHVDTITALVDTGLRGSELWRLEARAVDLTRSVLTIWRAKNAKPRTVPTTGRVKAILERRLTTTAKGHPLFPFGNNWLGDTFDRAKDKMGLSEDNQCVPYALRHTCASRLVQRGISLPVIQQWMGHKTITVTMRYAYLSPDNLIKAVKVLEPHLRGDAEMNPQPP
ncbi:MAG: tyrosine-type recombinase/integrase [Nitrospiraceae bacterium]